MSVVIVVAGQREFRISEETITVGRDPACTIPLSADERLQPQHAVIRRVLGRWMVEAKGSELIQVGDGRPTQMGWLSPGDTIRLAADGPVLTFHPETGEAPQKLPVPSQAVPAHAAAGATAAVANPPPLPAVERPATAHGHVAAPAPVLNAGTREAAGDRGPFWWAAGGAALIVAGTILAAFVFWLAGTFDKPPAAATPSGAGVAPQPNPTEFNATGTVVGSVPDAEVERPVTTPAGTPVDPASGVYLVLVSSNQSGGQTYQLGTAWVVAERRLVTSAAIATGIESLKDVAPRCHVRAPGASRTIGVTGRRIHPRYSAAAAEAQSAQTRAESLRLDLEQAQNQDRAKTLTEQVVEAEERRFQALERMVDCDLAMLEVSEKLPNTLAMVPRGELPPRPGKRVLLCGLPFGQEDYILDPDRAIKAVTAAGSVLTIPSAASQAGARRWFVRCQKELGAENWSGAPVLDGAGRVVGVYSRPTPPPTGVEGHSAGATHDVTDVSELAALGIQGN